MYVYETSVSIDCLCPSKYTHSTPFPLHVVRELIAVCGGLLENCQVHDLNLVEVDVDEQVK